MRGGKGERRIVERSFRACGGVLEPPKWRAIDRAIALPRLR
jgi:hypothetical protein